MPRIFFGEVLACEDVSEVGATVGALNFCSHAVGVRFSYDGAWDFVVEAWPAAVGFKLVFRTVKFCAAAFTNVGAFFPETVVFACKGHLCAFVYYDLFFLWG